MKMPALLYLLFATAFASGLGACGVSETDGDRFELAAARIAAIPLEPEKAGESPASASTSNKAPLRVELVTPHQLWDARDGVAKAAPVAAKIITLSQNDVADWQPEAEPVAPEAPQPAQVQRVAGVPAGSDAGRMVQLGAFANQAAAQQAWGRLGAAAHGLSPVYEPVSVNGRDLVRLKVRVDGQQAQALCAVAAASDAWCMKAAS